MNDSDDGEYIPPDTPADLSEAGAAYFRSVADQHMLTGAEQRVLYDIAAMADMLAVLEASWHAAGSPMTTKGSRGQEVTHPLIAEMRFHRSEMSSMVARLKLEKLKRPEDEDAPIRSGPMTRQESAKKAAQTRWHKGAS